MIDKTLWKEERGGEGGGEGGEGRGAQVKRRVGRCKQYLLVAVSVRTLAMLSQLYTSWPDVFDV